MQNETNAPPTTQLQRTLGLTDAIMIGAGSMIGSGIFIVSADMIRNVGGVGIVIAIWVITGLLCIIAALTYGELAGMYPKAGGQYVYLREAYGPLVGFLYGWAFFIAIQTGTIAAVGVGFSKFAAYLFPALSEKNILFDLGFFRLSAAQVVSIVMIMVLTAINARSMQSGRWIQLIFTFTKLGSLAALIIFGFLLGTNPEVWQANWAAAWQPGKWMADTRQFVPMEGGWTALLIAMAVASVGSLFSMEAWNGAASLAGEIKNPRRNVPLGLFLGVLVVMVLFVSTNIMYSASLTAQDIAFAKDDRVGIAAARTFLGEGGVGLIAFMIMVSTFGCNNGLIMAGARVYYSMAKDGLFFPKAAQLNSHAVPGYALWAQGIWASVLCLSGRYGDLLDFVVFTVLLFYVLTIAGVFILRRKYPDAERPYRALGYPILPALYMLIGSSISVVLLFYKPNYSWPGLMLVLLGVPLYYLLRKQLRPVE
jgi:basic amino acid/polyamine antiporter, APA family